MLRARGRTLDAAGAVLAAAQVGGAALLVPRGDALAWPGGADVGVSCLSRAVLGLDCPFCGMSRSFVALAHGDVARAFAFHAAGPLLFAAMVVFLVAVTAAAIRRAPPLFARPRFLFAFQSVAITCLAIGVLQMVRS